MYAFLSTEVGQEAMIDQQAQAESFGVTMTDAQYERLKEIAGSNRAELVGGQPDHHGCR